jgi:hypothetical protein
MPIAPKIKEAFKPFCFEWEEAYKVSEEIAYHQKFYPSLHCVICHKWGMKFTEKLFRIVYTRNIGTSYSGKRQLTVCKECYNNIQKPKSNPK